MKPGVARLVLNALGGAYREISQFGSWMVHVGSLAHWVPLTTSSVTSSTRLERADFFATKSLTVMLKSSVTTTTHLKQATSLYFVTRCERDPVYMDMVRVFKWTSYSLKGSCTIENNIVKCHKQFLRGKKTEQITCTAAVYCCFQFFQSSVLDVKVNFRSSRY